MERKGFFFFDRRDFLPGCTLFFSEKRKREKISISRLNRYLKLRNIASGSGYLGLLDAGYPVGESLYCIVSHMLLRCLQLGFKGAVKVEFFPTGKVSNLLTSGTKGTHLMAMFAFKLRLQWFQIPINSLSYTV